MAAEELPQTATALVHTPTAKSLSIESLPVPEPAPYSPQAHLIRVHAVAITNGELTWPEPATAQPPIPGYEVAGTVLSAPGDSPFQPGAAVYARTSFDREGNARPYSIALTEELGHKPKNLDWAAAATVPLSALTAWQALFIHGGLAAAGTDGGRNSAKRILVTAASGGVGIWAVQLAHQAGAYVVASCGPSNIDFVKELGADDVIDYTKVKDLSKWDGEKFDLVIDSVGGAALEQAWTVVKDNGILISIVQPPEAKRPASVPQSVKGLFFIVEANGPQLEQITALIEAEKVKTAFDSSFPLTDYDKAFARVQGGHLRGKVVLEL